MADFYERLLFKKPLLFTVEVKRMIRLVWNPLCLHLKGFIRVSGNQPNINIKHLDTFVKIIIIFFQSSLSASASAGLVYHAPVYRVRLSRLIFAVLADVDSPLSNGKEPSLVLISPVFSGALHRRRSGHKLK